MRAPLAETRFRALIISDAGMREVSADDIAAFLDANHAGARDSEQFRAAERDAAYSSREEGGE